MTARSLPRTSVVRQRLFFRPSEMQTERTGGELLLSEVAGKAVDSMQLTTSIGIQSAKWGGVVERLIGREVRGVEQLVFKTDTTSLQFKLGLLIFSLI